MIHINLLPVREITAEVTRRRDLVIGGTTIVLTLLLLFGVHLYQSFRVSSLGNQLADLRKEIEALNVKVKEVGELQAKIKELKGKTQVLDELNKKKVGPVRVMESLSAATPSGLWITEYREAGSEVTIAGMAMDNQTVADFLKALSTFAYFRNVELVETTQADAKAGSYKKFAIRSGVSYQPRLSVDGQNEKQPATKEDRKG